MQEAGQKSSRLQNWAFLLGNCRDFRTIQAFRKGASSRETSIRLRGIPGEVAIRPNTTDILVAWEIFGNREYECSSGRWGYRTILDLGANCGMFAAYCVRESRRAGVPIDKYIGVEPDPDAFGQLERQAQAIGLGEKAHLFRAAVASSDGVAQFDSGGASWAGHLSRTGSRSVETLTIGTLLDRAGVDQIDLAKVDIEGGERDVVEHVSQWSSRVRTVVIELHDGLDFEWFRDHMRRAGFQTHRAGELFRGHPAATIG